MYVLRNYSADQLLDRLLTVILFFTAGLALSRLLYEGLFPHFLWLGHPLSAFLLAAIVTIASWVIWSAFWWRGEGSRHSHAGSTATMPFTSTAIFLPLILNLFYLIDPVVDLETSRFLFAASLWLSAVFLARQLARPDQWPWLGALFLWAGLFPLYLLTMPAVAGRADTFEFQVVIPQLGIAHPTGYPLYILLGRLFAALPFGSVAWRINLASAVFATLAATMLYLAGRRLWKEKLAALLAAVLFGLTPTLWSQAVQAEVYALHALFVAGALYLMALMLDHGAGGELCAPGSNWQRPIWLLAFIIGLGLTNHLTTIILLPAAVLAVLLAYWGCFRAQDWKANSALLLKVALAFLLPLFIYVYLPLRWWALHEEPMGLAQFVDWVIGDRFQGALQLTAWLNDLTRYEIVWLLLLAEWGWINLLIAFLGLIYAAYRNWRSALVLLLVLAGYIFYALNYHVPDLAVFLIPAHAVIALFWGAAIAAVLALLVTLFQRRGWAVWTTPLSAALILLLALPALIRTVKNWPDTDYAGLVALQTWGEGVLALPLERNAAILADSEKIAPLYYLQQAEGLRPDLDILVLPDEAAYRAELDARIAAGQTVYLARFLPGLEGLYHLRSQGPLLEVSLDSLQELPTTAMPSDLKFDALRLLGYQIEEPALVDSEATAVTFYWQLEEPVVEPEFIYVRWAGRNFEGSPATSEGTHPAGNYYPTVAFRPGEIVADYHLFPKPFSGGPLLLDFQVAAGPQFAAAEDLTWQTVSRVEVGPAEAVAQAKEYRAQNGRMLLSQASFPDEIRPGTPLSVIVGGFAALADLLEFELLPLGQSFDRAPRPGTLVIDQTPKPPIAYMAEVNTDLANGRYQLLSRDPLAASFCGWLASPTSGCVLGEVAISGVPLPEDAANFDDKIVLLDIDLPGEPLISGGVLPVKLTWQGLADMTEDYTVFLQVLDDQDQIVGQVDAWPLQGTYPTGQWPPGEIVEDPYEIHLAGDLPPGNYRLQVGLYLLATLRRLPLLDAQGQPMDDKVVISGLVAE
jgi:4-amino-4-deoxy-L-arabinose transferase-like glycosyltransferase